jgi:Polysaccharide lyase
MVASPSSSRVGRRIAWLAGAATCALIAWPSASGEIPTASATTAESAGKGADRKKCAKRTHRANKGARGKKPVRRKCRKPAGTGGNTTTPPSDSIPAYTPPADPPADPDCPLAQPESQLTFVLPSACSTVASDTSSNPDPLPAWGSIDCQTASRHQQVAASGDSAPTAIGTAQGDSAFRRLTVIDGDNFWGERCELGLNDRRYSPTIYYHEGMRRATYGSYRLPSNFPLHTSDWQGAFQMKQANPADNGSGAPVISFGAYDGAWKLFYSEPHYTFDDDLIWSTPAEAGVWTRIALDVFYSPDPNVGWIKVYVDRTADGDFSDSGEQSPVFHISTLKYETGTNASDGLVAGQSIPSQLRIGMYHHPEISCPGPTGCSIETDNIQVIRP